MLRKVIRPTGPVAVHEVFGHQCIGLVQLWVAVGRGFHGLEFLGEQKHDAVLLRIGLHIGYAPFDACFLDHFPALQVHRMVLTAQSESDQVVCEEGS